jgi:hypothetical protein
MEGLWLSCKPCFKLVGVQMCSSDSRNRLPHGTRQDLSNMNIKIAREQKVRTAQANCAFALFVAGLTAGWFSSHI